MLFTSSGVINVNMLTLVTYSCHGMQFSEKYLMSHRRITFRREEIQKKVPSKERQVYILISAFFKGEKYYNIVSVVTKDICIDFNLRFYTIFPE